LRGGYLADFEFHVAGYQWLEAFDKRLLLSRRPRSV
jgi:hypothetical protein